MDTKLEDIKKVIIKKLKTLGVKIYANEVLEGYDTPCIFVNIPSYNNGLEYSNIVKKYMDIYIRYIDDDNITKFRVIDNINLLFLSKLEVNDRILTIYDKLTRIETEFAEVNFRLEYYEEILPTPAPLVTDIEIDI